MVNINLGFISVVLNGGSLIDLRILLTADRPSNNVALSLSFT